LERCPVSKDKEPQRRFSGVKHPQRLGVTLGLRVWRGSVHALRSSSKPVSINRISKCKVFKLRTCLDRFLTFRDSIPTCRRPDPLYQLGG
jgi:hypothetical protein